MNYPDYYEQLLQAVSAFQAAKPNDRSPKDRYFQLAITVLEKILAFIAYYIVEAEADERP